MSTSENRSAIKIVISSGKGGVGKSTTTASLGAGLAKQGYKVLAIDFDIILPKLYLLTNCESQINYDYSHLIRGADALRQGTVVPGTVNPNKPMGALAKVKGYDGNFSIITAPHFVDESLNNLMSDMELTEIVMDALSKHFDYILCDSPAGVGLGSQMAMRCADMGLIVTNPEIMSINDADSMIAQLDSNTRKAEDNIQMERYLIVNRYDANLVQKNDVISYQKIEEMLEVSAIGVVPQSDEAVKKASNLGKPVIETKTDVAEAYKDIVKRLIGQETKMRFTEPKGFLSRMFKGAA